MKYVKEYIKYRKDLIRKEIKTDKSLKIDPYTSIAKLKEIENFEKILITQERQNHANNKHI